MALETILSPKLKGNLKKAYEAYMISETEDEDEQAKETLSRCDDVFYENEEEINRMLKVYADKIKL